MKNSLIPVAILLTIGINPSHAGSLSNGVWTASGCGKQPELPILDNSDIAGYNQSVAAINDWQQKSRTYFECLIQEANMDNKLIVESTNKEQKKYQETLEKITLEAEVAAKNLTQK